MVLIRPFRALRPTPEKAAQVSCVPYDVADAGEVREFIAENPLSFLRVTRAEAAAGSLAGATALRSAEQSLESLRNEGVLVADPEPSLYVYRLSGDFHSQTGVVACCSLNEYEAGKIKKHESTRPDKVEERMRHITALRAQTGLIFLAYRGTDLINALVAETTKTPPVYDFVGLNGIRQTVWRVGPGTEIIEAFAGVAALYIADGHHRAESALLARNLFREQNPRHTGEEDYNFVLSCMFPAEQLKILAYNRAVRNLNGLSEEDFLAKLGESFIFTASDRREPRYHGEICMYVGGKWYDLRFAVKYVRQPDPIERLDVSILQQYILAPILGVDDPTTDERLIFIGGTRGTAELERMVDEGEARVAFSLYPTTMEDLFAVSDMDAIMPPKSTWFEPKLKDGLFVHMI